MKKNVVDRKLFDVRFNQLVEKAISYTAGKHEQSTEISFRTGYWADQEDYKFDVWNKAQRILDLDNWKTESDKDIIKHVTDTFSFFTDMGDRQNLVSPENYVKFLVALHNDTKETVSALKQLFFTDEDRKSFEAFVRILAKKNLYDQCSVIAYLFFLKDKDKYVTMRKEGYKKRFPKLGLDTSCLNVCTWDNYMEIVDVVKQIQELLSERMQENVPLVDAQSFLWMMDLVDGTTPEYHTPDDPLITSVATGYKEGRRIQYYTTKYERDPKNRAAAIKIHGTTCAVCGFDFEKKYGELGKGFIEVHHIKPLSSLDQKVKVDPDKDMVCLCANCHRMIHHKINTVLSVQELKDIIEGK